MSTKSEDTTPSRKLSGSGKSRSPRKRKDSKLSNTPTDARQQAEDHHPKEQASTGKAAQHAVVAQPQLAMKSSITPAQMKQLRTGPKANIFLGPVEDQFVAVEGAYKSLLCHFSGLAKKHLAAHEANRLHIPVPNGDQKVVVWIYRYMLAGGDDSAGEKKFEDLPLSDLATLYKHASALEYESLAEKAILRARYLIRVALGLLDTPEKLHLVASVPALRVDVADTITDEVTKVTLFNWDNLFRFLESDRNLREMVEFRVKRELKRLVSRSVKFYERFRLRPDILFSTQRYGQACGPARATPVAVHTKTTKLEKGQKPKRPRRSKRTAVVSEPRGYPNTQEGAQEGAAEAKTDRIPLPAGPKLIPKPMTTGTENSAPTAPTRKAQSKVQKPRKKFTPKPIIVTPPEPVNVGPSDPPAGAPTGPSQPNLHLANVQCYGCGKHGHVQKHCRHQPLADEPATCSNCKTTGHVARNCPHPQLIIASAPQCADASPAPQTRKPCYKCGKTGHLTKNCRTSHTTGYERSTGSANSFARLKIPPARQFASSEGNVQRGHRVPKTCHNCGELGHRARICSAPRMNTTVSGSKVGFAGPSVTMASSRLRQYASNDTGVSIGSGSGSGNGAGGVATSGNGSATTSGNAASSTADVTNMYSLGRGPARKRAKQDRENAECYDSVEIWGVGGITTSAREARRGQRTRLGLVIW